MSDCVRAVRVLGLLAALALLGAACGPPGEGAGDEEADAEATEEDLEEVADDVDEDEAAEVTAELEDVDEDAIVVHDAGWESLWVINEIFAQIVEEGYGHPVEEVTMSTPFLQQALPDGDADVATEMWCINHQDYCDAAFADGSIEQVGTVFSESEQGWYVPRYVIEGDEDRGIEPMAPDLEHVDDLPEHADLFEDPERPGESRLISGITGWDSTNLSNAKVYAYGLDEHFNSQDVGSAAAFDAEIVSAYENGEPILFYYWAPSWIMAELDLVLLDEPEWTPECDEALAEAAEDPSSAPEEAGCAFAGGEVEQAMNPDLRERAPEVAEMLERMYVGDEPINEALAYFEQEDADADEAARWYLEEFDDWHEWVDDDEVVERVEEALGA